MHGIPISAHATRKRLDRSFQQLTMAAFVIQCWKDGNRRGRHQLQDIKHRGYTGSSSNLEGGSRPVVNNEFPGSFVTTVF
ncbi:hypothetical protein [Neorhizobium sp. T6_25]|uniref:hypothetical protein n=1 Tax=Neorhizobium sp. T6_25 TaxID=2093833 RepID=UPI000CF966AD|nr:hypothetical protein [Neorhizobium sp. T6_25]